MLIRGSERPRGIAFRCKRPPGTVLNDSGGSAPSTPSNGVEDRSQHQNQYPSGTRGAFMLIEGCLEALRGPETSPFAASAPRVPF